MPRFFFFLFSLSSLLPSLSLLPFPTRRSSDLLQQLATQGLTITRHGIGTFVSPYGNAIETGLQELRSMTAIQLDRKSTRLNSSHVAISYAVFCLKKKKE